MFHKRFMIIWLILATAACTPREIGSGRETPTAGRTATALAPPPTPAPTESLIRVTGMVKEVSLSAQVIQLEAAGGDQIRRSDPGAGPSGRFWGADR